MLTTVTDLRSVTTTDQTACELRCGRCSEHGRRPTVFGLLLWDHPTDAVPALWPREQTFPGAVPQLPLLPGENVRVVTGSDWQRIEFHCPKCSRTGGRGRHVVSVNAWRLRRHFDQITATGRHRAVLHVYGDGQIRASTSD